MMEAVCTSDTPGYLNETTQRYIPEGYNLHLSFMFFLPGKT
jgi:hypothetical protein